MTQVSDSRNLRNLARVIVSTVVIAAFFLAKAVLVPFALALVFAFLLNPAVSWLERRRLGRIASVILVMAIFVGAAGITAWFVGTELIAVVNQLPSYKTNLLQKVRSLRNKDNGSLGKATSTVEELNKELSASNSPLRNASGAQGKESAGSGSGTGPTPVVVEAPGGAFSEAEGFLGPLVAPLATALIMVVFTLFMLSKREDVRNRLLRLAGKGRLNKGPQSSVYAPFPPSLLIMLEPCASVCMPACQILRSW